MEKLEETYEKRIKKMVNSLPLEEQTKVLTAIIRDETIMSLTYELATYRELCKKLLEEIDLNRLEQNCIAFIKEEFGE